MELSKLQSAALLRNPPPGAEGGGQPRLQVRPADEDVGIQRTEAAGQPGIQNRGTQSSQANPDAGLPRNQGISEAERQKLVLRPSEVPLEERMELVMSLEDVQSLLLLRDPMPEAPGLTDARQQNTTGRFLDLRS